MLAAAPKTKEGLTAEKDCSSTINEASAEIASVSTHHGQDRVSVPSAYFNSSICSGGQFTVLRSPSMKRSLGILEDHCSRFCSPDAKYPARRLSRPLCGFEYSISSTSSMI